MSANNDLERRISDYYETEAPSRPPEWILERTLASVETTQQRRIGRPWRFPTPTSRARLAVGTGATAALIAVAAVVLSDLPRDANLPVASMPAASLPAASASTTENSQPMILSYASSDGEVTASMPSTWRSYWPGSAAGGLASDVWFGLLWQGFENNKEHIGLVDPVAYDSWCAANGGSPLLSAPADAAAIAQKVIADPNFETTAPVAARICGLDAVSIDVALAPGGKGCEVQMIDISRWIHGLREPGWRLRLYLVDLPEGMSVETLAITVLAREDRFDQFIAETAPIIDSIEFHPAPA